jgi:hypothetical protein
MPKKTKAPGVKRSPEDIQKLMDKFVGFVKKNPGLRIEQINAQLGTSTKDLVIPVRRLIAAKQIRTKGEKRATTYEAKR